MFEMLAGRSPFDVVGSAENPDQNTEDYLFQGLTCRIACVSDVRKGKGEGESDATCKGRKGEVESKLTFLSPSLPSCVAHMPNSPVLVA